MAMPGWPIGMKLDWASIQFSTVRGTLSTRGDNLWVVGGGNREQAQERLDALHARYLAWKSVFAPAPNAVHLYSALLDRLAGHLKASE